MTMPSSVDGRLFFRAAKQRYMDAELLMSGGRTTGAVYMAGYAVECLLKAMLVEGVSKGKRQEVLAEFRGSKAHDIEWLLMMHRRLTGIVFPRNVALLLSRVAGWSTDLRYSPSIIPGGKAKDFVDCVARISGWAESRF